MARATIIGVQLLQELLLAWVSRSVSRSVDQRTKEHKQRPHGTRQTPQGRSRRQDSIEIFNTAYCVRVGDHLTRIKFTSKSTGLRYNLLKFTITQNLGNANARAHYHLCNEYQAVFFPLPLTFNNGEKRPGDEARSCSML